MSIFLTNPITNSLDTKDVGLFTRLRLAGKSRRDRRAMVKDLMALDDRILSDIGLSRGEILGFVARQSDHQLELDQRAARSGSTPNGTYLRTA